VADVHHFAFGWINPVLAYVLSFLGCLLGLMLAARSRESFGISRVRWLTLAAVAIGGTGIWLMHFMAMLGFDVPDSLVRYNVAITAVSAVFAVVFVALGLFVVGFGQPSFLRIIPGGVLTGLGVAAMHYTGMAAVRTGGMISYDRNLVALSVGIAVVASMVALWFAVVIRGASATVGAAALMGVAVCSMHYTAMAAVRVELVPQQTPLTGVSAFDLLAPISILSCVVISALAYSTIGFSIRQENAREEALLARARDLHRAAAMPRVGTGAARHRQAGLS
jgi:NO-binding membrane sensor protein with MHYT domain